MSQTQVISQTDSSFWGTTLVRPCGDVDAGWTTFLWNDYVETSNDVEHRTKPDPLTETAQPTQYKERAKVGVIDYPPVQGQTANWIVARGRDYSCPPGQGYNTTCNTYGRARLYIPRYQGFEPAETWQNQVYDEVLKQRYSLGQSLAEYRETARLFAKLADTMYKGYNTLRGRSSGLWDINPCTIAAADLAYNFGVKPLAEDVYSSLEVLRLKLPVPLQFVVEAYTKQVQKENFDWEYAVWCSRQQTTRHKAKVMVHLKPDDSQFSFGNPAIWAWELIPYSFVVDWGIDVGSYLQRLDAIRRIDFVTGTLTERINYSHQGTPRRQQYSGSYTHGSRHSLRYKSHERKLIVSLPLPAAPRWKGSATWTRLRRSTALLVAVISGRPVKEILGSYKNQSIPQRKWSANPCGKYVRRPRPYRRKLKSTYSH